MVQQLIRYDGNVAHGDSGKSDRTSLSHHSQRIQHQCSGGCKDDGTVCQARWMILGGSDPRRAEFPGEFLVSGASRYDVDFASVMSGQLQNDVRRAAEPEQSDGSALANSAKTVRTISDHSSAKKRRGAWIGKDRRDRICTLGWNDNGLGISAIHMKTCETRIFAEILFATQAEPARAIGRVQPRNTDAITFAVTANVYAQSVHNAHGLVTGYERHLRWVNIAFDDVQVGVTDAAGADANANLTRARRWQRPILKPKRLLLRSSLPAQNHRTHWKSLAPGYPTGSIGTHVF